MLLKIKRTGKEGIEPTSMILKTIVLPLNYFPKSVNVSFYTSLSAFNTIAANDFKVVCDYKAINEDSKYLEPELVKRPDNVKTTRLHQQKIEFIIVE